MARAKPYASSTDVARLAGVSQSAVSRTYKDGGSVSPATRRKVLEAARQLGYRPSLIPRIMLTHRSRLVAIVVGGMYNPFYSAVLERFAVRLQQIGHQALLVHADSGHSLEGALPRLASYRVDAIVSALAVSTPGAASELARLGVPVIAFNTAVDNERVSAVCCDNEGAARAVADLLVDRGATRFAYVAGPPANAASDDRLRGFRERLKERGAAAPEVMLADFHYEAGLEACTALRRLSGAMPDAIFCANDLIAFGVIDAIRTRLGLRVPEDVMVVGFDDVPAAAWAAYDLTTCIQDGPAMVDAAVAILDAPPAIPGSGVSGARTVVPVRIVERGTTRR